MNASSCEKGRLVKVQRGPATVNEEKICSMPPAREGADFCGFISQETCLCLNANILRGIGGVVHKNACGIWPPTFRTPSKGVFLCEFSDEGEQEK